MMSLPDGTTCIAAGTYDLALWYFSGLSSPPSCLGLH